MEFNRMLSELDAGLLIGGGATLIFAVLVYLMTSRNDEEDEATALYRALLSSRESNRHEEALALAKRYRVALNKKSRNANDLGESFFLIADAANHLGIRKLACLSAEIACHHLSEESVQAYPLYRTCREKSIQIRDDSRKVLSEEALNEMGPLLEDIYDGNMEGIDELFTSFEKS